MGIGAGKGDLKPVPCVGRILIGTTRLVLTIGNIAHTVAQRWTVKSMNNKTMAIFALCLATTSLVLNVIVLLIKLGVI
jgi:hypothetical protein